MDPRTRRFILPTRIVWQTDGSAAPENSVCLLTNNTGQATTTAQNLCKLRHTGEAPGFLLDFGKELHGGIQIVSGMAPRQSPIRVRIRFGESVTEAMGETNNDHALHDFVHAIPWCGATEVGGTGFRFVRIDLLDAGDEAHILSVRAVSLLRDIPYAGSFRCSDERLNRIWETGAYTVHLNMQDYVWDGIKRDRLVWIGDLHPETTVIGAVFGEHPIVAQSLDFVRDSTPLPAWMNGLSSYSLWWILIHRSWFQQFGNRAYLAEQRDYLAGLLGILCSQIGSNGQEQLQGARFLDWATEGNDVAKAAGLHALVVMAMRAGAELASELKEPALAKQALHALDTLTAFKPSLLGANKQAASLLALAGLYSAEEINSRVLASDPLAGLSTFYGYYVLQARAMAGDYAGGLDVIRRYWGGMLDLGATTFWEHFDIRWAEGAGRIDALVPAGTPDIHADFGDHCYKGLRHSLCHGWAAGPTAWLMEHTLGIRPMEPGCRTMRVHPHLEDLTFAEGSYPTPLGLLRVRHEKTSGGLDTVIDAPDGVSIVR